MRASFAGWPSGLESRRYLSFNGNQGDIDESTSTVIGRTPGINNHPPLNVNAAISILWEGM